MALLPNLTMLSGQPVVPTYNTLAQAATGVLSLSIAGTGTTALTDNQAANAVIVFTGLLTGTRTITCPAAEKPYILYNNTTGAFSLTFKTAAGTGDTILQGNRAFMYCDGTNVLKTFEVVGGNLVGGTGAANKLAVWTGTNTLASDTALHYDTTSNNLGVNATAFGTNANSVMALGIGTLPTTAGPGNIVQLAASDTDGVSSTAGLYVLTEDLTPHILGKQVGHGIVSGLTGMLNIRDGDGISTLIYNDSYLSDNAGGGLVIRHARGTAASPAHLNVNDLFGNFRGDGWGRNAADSGDAWIQLGSVRYLVESKDAQGRLGGFIEFNTGSGVSATATQKMRLSQDGTLVSQLAANGQSLNFPPPLVEEVVIAAAASSTSTIQIPAHAVVFGVSQRVTVAIPTAATFSTGVSGTSTRYGTGISVALNTTHPGTNTPAIYYGALTSILITPNATPATNVGRVRIAIHYFTITPATS